MSKFVMVLKHNNGKIVKSLDKGCSEMSQMTGKYQYFRAESCWNHQRVVQ